MAGRDKTGAVARHPGVFMTEEQIEQEKTDIELLREEFNKKFDSMKEEHAKEKEEMLNTIKQNEEQIADLKVKNKDQQDSITKYQKALVYETASFDNVVDEYEETTRPWTDAYNTAIKNIYNGLQFRNEKAKEDANKLIDAFRPW